MGAQQNSVCFARAAAKLLDLPRAAVRASVLGEHGEGMVPLWSLLYVIDAQGDVYDRVKTLQRQFSVQSYKIVAAGLRKEVERLLSACEVEQAYSLLKTQSPDLRILLEPLIAARVLNSTPNATANATLTASLQYVMGMIE